MNDQEMAYHDIFNLVPEMCKLESVKLVKKDKERSWKFIGILLAPTKLPNTHMGCKECREMALGAKNNHISGPDVIHTIKLKDDPKHDVRFDFSVHLTPDNIEEFEIENGLFKIRVVCYGTFY